MALSLLSSSSALGNSLNDLLMCPDIKPGDNASYQICKAIYTYHPIGKKMVDAPIAMAMSQRREVSVPGAPDRVVEAYWRSWDALAVDRHVANTMRLSRMYGIATTALVVEDYPPDKPLDYRVLASKAHGFNDLDPLNTAGSLVLNQDPNALDYLKVQAVAVNGVAYHRSRTCTVMHEDPIYIDYTSSAFGYVGRSVYQRALFPLKSFLQTMVADDMVARKCGLIVAMVKQAGSIVDQAMEGITAIKRALLQAGETNSVLSVGQDDKVESLNLVNIDGALTAARKNILENIASADDMPAQILNAETFAEGFGEGTEDAKHVSRYVDNFREGMKPLYDFFDPIVQHRAWDEEFYAALQKEFPEEYRDVPHLVALTQWRNAFTALWPSLLKEPESEQIKVEDVKLKAVIALLQVLEPIVDQENKAILVKWAADNFNEDKLLFQAPLELDWEAIAEHDPMEGQGEEEPDAAPPFSAKDADQLETRRVGLVMRREGVERALAALTRSVEAMGKRAA